MVIHSFILVLVEDVPVTEVRIGRLHEGEPCWRVESGWQLPFSFIPKLVRRMARMHRRKEDA